MNIGYREYAVKIGEDKANERFKKAILKHPVEPTVQDEQVKQYKAEMERLFLSFPAQAYITLSLHTPTNDVGKVTSHVIHWATWLQKRGLKSGVALLGVLSDAGESRRPHLHLLAYGHDRQGIAIPDNPRFSKLSKRTKHWPGFLKVDTFENFTHEQRARYMAFDNYSPKLFDLIYYATNKTIMKEVNHVWH